MQIHHFVILCLNYYYLFRFIAVMEWRFHRLQSYMFANLSYFVNLSYALSSNHVLLNLFYEHKTLSNTLSNTIQYNLIQYKTLSNTLSNNNLLSNTIKSLFSIKAANIPKYYTNWPEKPEKKACIYRRMSGCIVIKFSGTVQSSTRQVSFL